MSPKDSIPCEVLTRTFEVSILPTDDELQAIVIIDKILSDIYGSCMDQKACRRVINYFVDKYSEED